MTDFCSFPFEKTQKELGHLSFVFTFQVLNSTGIRTWTIISHVYDVLYLWALCYRKYPTIHIQRTVFVSVVSDATSLSYVSGLSEVSEVSGVSDVSGASQFSGISEVSKVSNVPEVSGISQVSGV